MKSHARSLRVFSPSVLAAAVTVSRTSPNWKMNVTSGPSIFFPTADSLLQVFILLETNCCHGDSWINSNKCSYFPNHPARCTTCCCKTNRGNNTKHCGWVAITAISYFGRVQFLAWRLATVKLFCNILQPLQENAGTNTLKRSWLLPSTAFSFTILNLPLNVIQPKQLRKCY